MSGLTENGIIALNFSWIQQVCKSQHRALPYQERLSEGLIGFFIRCSNLPLGLPNHLPRLRKNMYAPSDYRGQPPLEPSDRP